MSWPSEIARLSSLGTKWFLYLSLPEQMGAQSRGSVSISENKRLLSEPHPDTQARWGEQDKGMFSESLLENSAPARRHWPTFISFIVEVALLALLVLIPLLSSVALPAAKSIVINIPFGSPRVPPTTVTSHPRAAATVPIADSLRLHVPTAIPHGIRPEPATPASEAVPIGIGSGMPFGDRNIPAILNIPNTVAVPPPPSPAPEPVRIRVSQMEPGALIHQVQPVYPAPAKITRVQGTVQLAAVIARDGSIKDLRAISGHPMLVRAAVDAVSQWLYRPYILNGQAVEVETQINVNFTLGQQ